MPNKYYEQYGYNQSALTNDMQYILKQAEEPVNAIDILDAAAKEALSPYAVGRIWERRSSQFEPDPEWGIDDRTNEELKRDYTPKDEEYLRDAKSENEFVARKRFIEEDRERQRVIGEAGLGGIAATVGLSLLDPGAIALSAATGPLGVAGKSAGIAKALRIGALSGIENAVLETVLMKSNTQADWSDVAVAFGAGAAIGGAISPFIRTRKPHAVNAADNADNAVKTDVDNLIAKEITDAAKGERVDELSLLGDVDVRKVRQNFDDYEIRLTRETEGTLTKGQRSQIDKRVKKTKAKLQEVDNEFKVAQAEVEAKRNAFVSKKVEFSKKYKEKVNAIKEKYKAQLSEQKAKIEKIEKKIQKKETKRLSAKLWEEETRLNDIIKKQDRDIKAINKKIKDEVTKAETTFNRAFARKTNELQARRQMYESELDSYVQQLVKADRAKDAANRLRRWNQMSDTEKLKQMYGDNYPKRQEEVARQIEAAKPMDTVSFEGVGAMGFGQRIRHRAYTLPFETEKKIAQLAYQGGKIPDDLRGRRILPKFTKILQSVHTRLSNSDSMVVRGLTYHLFEAPQGGHAAKVTAAARVKNYSTIIRSAMRNRLREGLQDWAKQNNVSYFKSLWDGNLYNRYNKEVMLEVKFPGTSSNQAVINAAEGVRDQLRTAGKIRKDAGEQGFENLDLDKDYIPIILKDTLIKQGIVDNSYRTMVDLLSLGYQRGKYKLNKKLADRIAEGYIARAKNNTLAIADYVRMTRDADLEDLVNQLQKAGIDKDVIDDFLESTGEKELKEHMSNRAKKSLEPDFSVELNGVKFIDFMECNLPKLLESYTRDAAGGAALAKLGFPTRHSIMSFLNDIQRHAVNSGMNEVQIIEELQVLKDGVNLLYGRSLNPDPHSPLVRNLSRLRDLTSFLRLQTVGISSIPEIARITTQRGIAGTLEACPDLGIGLKGTKAIRKGGKYSGHFERPDLEELEEVLGYVGEDHVLYPDALRSEDLEEAAVYNSVGYKIDTLLSQGRRVQEVVSAFRAVQGGGERIAARSLGSQIKKWVEGTGDGLRKADIADAGWHDGFLDEVKEWMLANPATDTFNGREIRLFNFGKMPAEMQERLQIGIHRLVSRDMQRPLIGETPIYMHKWLGQVLTQFRSFSLLSFEKQLIHDIRHDRAAAALIFLHSAVLSYVALTINTLYSAIGRDDADEYIKNRLTGSNAVLGCFNRMGQLASAGVALDGLATLGALPDDLMVAPGRTGFRGLTTTNVPIIGAGQDVLDVSKDLFDIIKGDPDANKTLKDIQQITPFGKSIGINQAFNATFDLLD